MKKLLKQILSRPYLDGYERSLACAKRLLISSRPVSGKTDSHRRFLDVGCGDGSLSIAMAAAAQADEIHGIEFDEASKKTALQQGIRCVQHDVNVGPWPFEDAFFDVVFSNQNLEHIHNTRLYLEESLRILKPGGRIILTTPNLAAWMNVASLLMGWQPFSTTPINRLRPGNPLMALSPWPDDDRDAMGHIRVLAYLGLLDMLRIVGFQDATVLSRGYLPFWGSLSDFVCDYIDARHGQYLVAVGCKGQ